MVEVTAPLFPCTRCGEAGAPLAVDVTYATISYRYVVNFCPSCVDKGSVSAVAQKAAALLIKQVKRDG